MATLDVGFTVLVFERFVILIILGFTEQHCGFLGSIVLLLKTSRVS